MHTVHSAPLPSKSKFGMLNAGFEGYFKVTTLSYFYKSSSAYLCKIIQSRWVLHTSILYSLQSSPVPRRRTVSYVCTCIFSLSRWIPVATQSAANSKLTSWYSVWSPLPTPLGCCNTFRHSKPLLLSQLHTHWKRFVWCKLFHEVVLFHNIPQIRMLSGLNGFDYDDIYSAYF